MWSGAKEYLSFFFDELFACDGAYPENVSAADAKRILDEYAAIYDPADDSGVWFDRIKALAERLGYAANMKDYKQNPCRLSRAASADVSMVLRVAVTGRQNSPDMYEIMRLLGRERVAPSGSAPRRKI